MSTKCYPRYAGVNSAIAHLGPTLVHEGSTLVSPNPWLMHLAYDGFDVTVKVQSLLDVLVEMENL